MIEKIVNISLVLESENYVDRKNAKVTIIIRPREQTIYRDSRVSKMSLKSCVKQTC